MSYEIKISAQHQLGIVRFSSVVTGDTILQALDTLYKGETWVPQFNAIWDCRTVIELGITPREADCIVERMEKLSLRMGEGRTAVVAPRSIDAAFARMLFTRSKCSFRERRVFPEVDGALAWLIEAYPARKQKIYGELPIRPL